MQGACTPTTGRDVAEAIEVLALVSRAHRFGFHFIICVDIILFTATLGDAHAIVFKFAN